MIRRQRLFFTIGGTKEDQPKPRIDRRRRPDIAATAILNPINLAFSANPAVNLEPPNQFPGFCVERHEPSAVRYLELDPTGVSAEK
jgi:hypothetical protein